MSERKQYVIEYLAIMALCFSLFLLPSITQALFADTTGSQSSITITADALVATIGVYLGLGGLSVVFLWWRGWRPNDFQLDITLGRTAFGVVLFVLTFLCFQFLMPLVKTMAETEGQASASMTLADNLPMALILCYSIIGAMFEEFFLLGYTQAVFARIYPGDYVGTAIAAGTMIRLGYFLDQGLTGAIVAIVLGGGWGALYMKRPMLWPFVSAHAMLNALQLVTMA